MREESVARSSAFSLSATIPTKDKRVVLSKQAKVVNDVYGGNWGPMRQRLDAFFGGKKQFKQDEAERLKEAYGRPRFPEEDQESA